MAKEPRSEEYGDWAGKHPIRWGTEPSVKNVERYRRSRRAPETFVERFPRRAKSLSFDGARMRHFPSIWTWMPGARITASYIAALRSVPLYAELRFGRVVHNCLEQVSASLRLER